MMLPALTGSGVGVMGYTGNMGTVRGWNEEGNGMKYSGTIMRIQRGRDGITLIVQTSIGLRGVELDRALWDQVLADFDLEPDATLEGWFVEYDPAHGDLEIIAPSDDDVESV